MTENQAKWPSNDRQIIKSKLSSRRRGKSLPPAVDSAYHWTRYECYLGNVGLSNFFLGLLTGGSSLPPQMGYEFGVYMDAHDIKVDQIVLRQFRRHLNEQGHFELREGGDATLELIVVKYGFKMPMFDFTKNMRNPFLNIRATLRSKDSTVLWSNFDFVMQGSELTHAYRIQALWANPRLVERSLEEASCVIAYLLLSELHPVRPSSHGSTREQLGGPICDPVVHIEKPN